MTVLAVDLLFAVFFFKQKTAYEIPKRDWSSDVVSSDLLCRSQSTQRQPGGRHAVTSPSSRDRSTMQSEGPVHVRAKQGVVAVDRASLHGGRSEERRVGKE